MPQLVYKFLPPRFDGPQSEKCSQCHRSVITDGDSSWVPYLQEGNERILFSSVKNLNDPFECGPMDLTDFVDKRLLTIGGGLLSQGGFFSHVIKLRERFRVRDVWWQTKFILSMSANCHSSAMWAHYAKKHSGICIGFKSQHAFFKGSKFRLTALKPIEYRSSVSTYSREDHEPIFYTKAIEWAYEEEMRMLCDLSDWREPEGPINDGVDYKMHILSEVGSGGAIADQAAEILGVLVKLPHEAISEIIVGHRASPDLISWVKQRAKSLDVMVYQAHPSEEYFKMDKVLLSN